MGKFKYELSFLRHLRLFAVLFIASFLVGNNKNCYAQLLGQSLIDSLQKRLPLLSEDTFKVNVLNTIAYKYYFVNADNGIPYARKAMYLAGRLNYAKGIATAHKNLGTIYMNRAVYDTALFEYTSALNLFNSINDSDGEARVMGNIGMIYDDLGDYLKALDYELKALGIYDHQNNKEGKSRIYGNLGIIYQTPKKFADALHYDTLALKLHQESGDQQSIAIDLGNIGNVYLDLKDYHKALAYDNKALELYTQMNDTSAMANKLQNLADVYGNMEDYKRSLDLSEQALQLYTILNDKQGMGILLGNMGAMYLGIAQQRSKGKKLEWEGDQKQNIGKAIEFSTRASALFKEIGAIDYLQACYHDLALEYEFNGNSEEALKAEKEYIFYKDSVNSTSKRVAFANLEKQRAIEEKNYALEQNAIQIKLNDVIKTKKRNESVLFLIGMFVLIVGMILLIRQRRLTEKLLLNILPPKIARRLKRKEYPIADHFTEASIIFADIVGFTVFSEQVGPDMVVTTLNDIFTKLDAIADKFGLEKIKTIGDCYMVVAGLPEPRADHPILAAKMALEIKKVMDGYLAPDGSPIRMRIGIDCGSIVSGVIGKKKFIYDVWGDAVNTASRMESSGLPGEIHCTDNFKNKLPPNFIFRSRGAMNIKSKGMMETWILEGVKD